MIGNRTAERLRLHQPAGHSVSAQDDAARQRAERAPVTAGKHMSKRAQPAPRQLRPPRAVLSSSVIRAPRRQHSRKPDKAYEIIERMYPTLPKIELFARNVRDGWAAWGNQAPSTTSTAGAAA
jgi:hypothetical protein